MKKFTINICILLLLCLTQMAVAQAYTATTSPRLRTLRMQAVDAQDLLPKAGDPTRPYLMMANGATITAEGDADGFVLEVSFDEMSHDVHQYTYTVCHADRYWKPDALLSSEYLGGFTTRDITDYEHSLNTQQIYTHYSLTIPNEDMSLKLSGNYILTIYEDGNPENVIATQCFYVVDQQVQMNANITPNTDIELSGRYQQLEVEINKTQGNTPRNDYSLCVQQNGRLDNAVYDVVPTLVGTNKLQWNHCRELIFEGGSEYRHFDIYSTYLAGDGVDRIIYEQGDYHALLYIDGIDEGTYIHRYDAHGQYRINAERTDYDDTEAEYMWVHFVLPKQDPWFTGAVYVGGDLFNNRMTLANRMQYDNENRCYYLNALVKQGGYDYQYWFVEKGKNKATLQPVEGSHWQTRNEYTLLVYYKPFGARYDQLVGFVRIQ